MTTIDIQFKMTSRNPDSFRVRIVRDAEGEDGEIMSTNSPKMSRNVTSKKLVNREKSANEMMKSPARRLKKDNPSSSIDVSEMFYSADQFTITAYLPNEDMEGEKQTRLKIPCYTGMTVQQVIENELPQLANTSYLVYQFPSKALLNPERDASVLQGQEIWIEPARLDSAEDTSDRRLAIVRVFYRTEDAYLEHLRNIFDVYMEPLSIWGISQSDMNTLFLPLSRLCDLLMNFFSELELAVKSWNTHTTLIGGIFKQYNSFWEMYIEYAQNYTVAMRLLKQMRTDESFNKFLNVKRGAAMHTLESLMLLPVQRVSDYNRYMNQLLVLTTRDHRDYQNIRLTVARTEEIIQARADELVYLQNESKLEQVQLQFPNDHLFLSDALDIFDHQKRRSNSQTPTGMHKHSNSGILPRTSKTNIQGVHPLSDSETDGIGGRKNLRMYIQEGPIKLIHVTLSKQIEQERYMFLFSDLLLIAKPKAGRTHQHRCYRLKQRLKLGEMWVAEYNATYAHGHRPECSFIVGWPQDNCISRNCIAVFNNEALKSLWFNHISKHILMQRKLCLSDSISTHILNMTKNNNNNNIPEFIGLHVSDTVQDVIRNSVNIFDIKEPPENFQLWVKLPKEDREELLHGFESPFAIQDHHNKLQMDHSGTDLKPQQLEFILKRKLHHQVVPNPRSSIFKFGRKRPKGNRFSKQNSKGVKMFGVPLDQLIVNNQLPERLQEILIRLWVDAPSSFGIFRQSPSVRKIREIREGIDGNEPVDLSEVSIHVIGAILKDLLRNVPGGVIPSARYTEFVATNDIDDYDLRIEKIRIILNKLPTPNQTLIRYLLPLLAHISKHVEENGMSSTNLAICFAPSLLEPDFSLSVIKNEAPMLVDFMIIDAPAIYNHELPDLFKHLEAQSDREIHYVPLKDEDDIEMSETFYQSHNRGHSLDMTSASEDSLDEDDSSPRRVRLLQTSSDSNVTEILSNSGIGRVTLLSDRSEEVSTGIEGDESEMEEEYDEEYSPQRPMQSRLIRTRHGSGESSSRRRTIGTQSNYMYNKHHYSPELNQHAPMLSRVTAFKNGYSPKNTHYDSMDSDATGFSGNRSEPSAVRQSHKKKKRKPGHSNSFSKPSDLKHTETCLPQSSSSISFDYDSLSPGDRPRSRSVAVNTGVQTRSHLHEDILTKSLEHTIIHNSNQSLSSRTSGSSAGSVTQSRGTQTQSHRSSVQPLLTSARSGSNNPSPDLSSVTINQTSNTSDDIKTAISNRFGLVPSSLNKPSATMYDSDVSQETLIPGEEDYDNHKHQQGSMSDYSYRKEPYHNYPMPTEGMKRMESVETTTSIDDRPEAERHFNGGGSLPRITMEDYKQSLSSGGSLGRKGPFGEIMPLGNVSVDNGSRLTIISGGYNSDTESSPSRTLSRQEKKLQEVSSPQTMRSSIPNRFSKQFTSSVEGQKVSVTSHVSPNEGRGRSTTINHSSYTSTSDKESSPRHRSQTVSLPGGPSPSGVQDDKKDQMPARTKRASTYEAYQKRYENETSSRASSTEAESIKLNSSPLDVTTTSTISDEFSTSPSIGSKIMSVPLTTKDVKSRSMPDYAKKAVSRTLTSTSTVKTVKVVRYELPMPKRIRRINLRAYNINK